MPVHRPRAAVLASALVVTSLIAPARPSAAESTVESLAKVGAWIQPFEEGGAAVPRCQAVQKEGWENGQLVCKPSAADLAGMADGRVLIAGGIDWYNEPDFMARHRGDPADVGVVELGGLKTTRIFDPATNSFNVMADMHHPRWYPTLVELPDGKFLVAS